MQVSKRLIQKGLASLETDLQGPLQECLQIAKTVAAVCPCLFGAPFIQCEVVTSQYLFLP